jgi:hypothetical protein
MLDTTIIICLEMRKKQTVSVLTLIKDSKIHENTKGSQECEKIGSDW